MTLKTVLATLAVLGSGASLGACGGEEKAPKDAKEVPHAKEGEKAKAADGGEKKEEAHAKGDEGEMTCAPGKCGANMGEADDKKGEAGEGDKGLADQAKKDGAPADEKKADGDPDKPAT
jgi:hypothetical protein